jgi:hypothetical protein
MASGPEACSTMPTTPSWSRAFPSTST